MSSISIDTGLPEIPLEIKRAFVAVGLSIATEMESEVSDPRVRVTGLERLPHGSDRADKARVDFKNREALTNTDESEHTRVNLRAALTFYSLSLMRSLRLVGPFGSSQKDIEE